MRPAFSLHPARFDGPEESADALPLPFQIPSLQDTYGALFIGMCLCILLAVNILRILPTLIVNL